MAYEKDYRTELRPEMQQNIVIENRRRATISGVTDVESFDENEIVMATSAGTLFLHGTDLRVGKLSLDTGDIVVDGEIVSFEYDDDVKPQGSFFGRLFK